MNLILFDPAEVTRPLPRTDPRAVHLLEILRRREGETFDAGVLNGPRGKGTLRTIDASAVVLEFAWDAPPPPLPLLTLIVGLPRPQTARDILRDATTLGVTAIDFVKTDRGEPNYAQSTLWRTGEWQRHLRAGAEQAFDTRVPTVTHGETLDAILAQQSTAGTRIALDNYESPGPLSAIEPIHPPVIIALGSERGWSPRERDLLRATGFSFAHLGSRVLRTETACVAAITLLRAKLGLL